MSVSIVIPTRNRRAGLAALLERLAPQAGALSAEVVVVDNASTDGTAELVRDLAARSGGRVRHVREEAAGATRARNAGARQARGEVVAFIDDDALPAEGWLGALTAPFAAPGVACAGGRVVLRFPSPPPAWWDDHLAGYLAAYDLGATPLNLGTRLWYDSPRALNMAVRRRSLAAVGGFSERLGPVAGRPSVGEESELCYRLLAHGEELRYVPGAVVEHVVVPSRLDPAWFFRRAFWTGWSEAMNGLAHRPARKVLGLVRWHYRAHWLRLPYRPSGTPEALRVWRECERREALGYVLGLARFAFARRALRDAPAPW